MVAGCSFRMTEKAAREIAINEALTPTLGSTEQVLSEHKLIVEDNVPLILLVDTSSDIGAFYTYFGTSFSKYSLKQKC